MWPNLWGSNMWPYIYSTQEGEEQRRYPGKMPSLARLDRIPREARPPRMIGACKRCRRRAPEEKKKNPRRESLLGVCSSNCSPNSDGSRRRRRRIHTDCVSFRSSNCLRFASKIVSYKFVFQSKALRKWNPSAKYISAKEKMVSTVTCRLLNQEQSIPKVNNCQLSLCLFLSLSLSQSQSPESARWFGLKKARSKVQNNDSLISR